MRFVNSYYSKDGSKWNRDKLLQIKRKHSQNVTIKKSGVKEKIFGMLFSKIYVENYSKMYEHIH